VLAALVLAGFTAGGSRCALAQDRVVVLNESTGSRMTYNGVVEEYNGRELVLRPAVGQGLRQFPAKQVLEVRTVRVRSHEDGRRLLADHRGREAAVALDQAFKDESRRWVRRDILALLIRCSLFEGDYRLAGTRFLLLVGNDPETRHYGLIPLAWRPGRVGPGLVSEAREWRSRGSDTASLLAASHLLNDSKWRPTARNDLKRLASSTDRRVRSLATALLWRPSVESGRVSPSELAGWNRQLRTMPEPLRGGPYYLIGRAHASRFEHEPAAAAFLRTSLVYDHDHHLAARATREAALALLECGRDRAAVTLIRDLQVRFPDSPAARQTRLPEDRPAP